MTVVLFFAVTIALAGYSLSRRDGVYEFPFLATMAVMLYVGPQLLAFERAEGGVFGGEMLLFTVLVLCSLVACHLGFYMALGPARRRAALAARAGALKTFPARQDLVVATLGVLVVAGWYSFIRLSALAGGVGAFLSGGFRDIRWEDEAVWYTFFIQNLQLVFALSLFLWDRRRDAITLCLTLASVAVPALYAVELRRRSVFFDLAIIVALFYFFKGRRIPKLYIPVAVVVALFVVVAFPQLRKEGVTLSDVVGERPSTALLLDTGFNEVKNGALATSASLNAGRYEYGWGFLSQLIKDTVPSALVGRETKERLVGQDRLDLLVFEQYDFDMPSNEFRTGVAWMTFQFGLFGVLFWGVLGAAFAALWARATATASLAARALYAYCAPLGMTAFLYSPGAEATLLLRCLVIFAVIAFLGGAKRGPLPGRDSPPRRRIAPVVAWRQTR